MKRGLVKTQGGGGGPLYNPRLDPRPSSDKVVKA
jgi:hypothetical protein